MVMGEQVARHPEEDVVKGSALDVAEGVLGQVGAVEPEGEAGEPDRPDQVGVQLVVADLGAFGLIHCAQAARPQVVPLLPPHRLRRPDSDLAAGLEPRTYGMPDADDVVLRQDNVAIDEDIDKETT
jgi:hypothetical protein